MTEAERVAIFKYGIIAPIINDSSTKQKQYFEKAAELDYDYPGQFGRVNFKARTFKKWLHLYRKFGYEGLKPSRRNDKGKSRKISPITGNCIAKIFQEYDFKTVSNFYRHIVSEILFLRIVLQKLL